MRFRVGAAGQLREALKGLPSRPGRRRGGRLTDVSGGLALDLLDLVVVAGYGALVLWIGLRAGRRGNSRQELMLGGRSLPAWAVLCSTVATELSAATFVGVPHAAYTGDWTYLQLAFGAAVAKLVLAARVIPLYHRLRVVTVYGFLGTRFGPRSRA